MKADLHLHSRHSDRAADWLFRRFNFPDSYSEPKALYALLRQRGMDFVTLTDHNNIDGCLEIAGQPGVFLSEEVTTYFPEDRCKIHLLVWGLTEAQHQQIADARESIFELQHYLAAENLAHAVAHPLYSLNQKLGVSHIERLILLFKCFEGLNGLRDHLLNEVAQHLFASLTPEKIAQFAERHGLEPTHPEPWKKTLTAGSNDHGGMFAAAAYTETPACGSPAEFLECIRRGQTQVRGAGGTPLALSHSLYNTAYSFAKDKLLKSKHQTPELLETMFARFMEGENPTEFTFAEKLNFLAQGILTGKIFELAKPANASLWRELSGYFSQPAVKAALARQTANVPEPERRAFLIANLFANQLAFRFFAKFVRQLSGGNMIEGLQAVSAIAPLALLLSPYIYAFKSQSPNRRQLRKWSREIAGDIAPVLHNEKRAWFTDTLEDVNGVATTIQKMTASGVALGHDLTVVTSRTNIDIAGIPIKNFPPVGEFEIPEYELQKLTFPPMLEMLDYIQRERFTELIISTPGPIGITALLAAKMLHLRTVGIYHTDFPQYVQILTDDHFMESLTWRYMHWFYQELDIIYVNSEQYRTSWIERGIDGAKIKILPRGLDTVLFHPSRRESDFWIKRGAKPGELIMLYVGRISVEKNLDVFAAAHDKARAAGLPVRAALVGNGVYLKTLQRLLPDACFTGYLSGEELARAYASADVFVFPSVSDTFGNVVIESQACGIPVIVSDQKGPQELVENGVTGFITRGRDADDLAAAIGRLGHDPDLRGRMGAAARRAVENRNWSAAFEKFWSMSEK
jgi:glycosyltransferase involved in cell wall biosynthesis/predicted metal-dependent phosphoesterase TrpH